MLKFITILFFSLCLAGCTNTRFYDSLSDLPKTHKLSIYNSIAGVNSSILTTYLTADAYQTIKNIPIIDGLMIKPFVVGVNPWSSLAGIILFNGYERKIVISKEYLRREEGPRTILHEYIHHLDDMDRDGKGRWIDHREFAIAFHRLLQDPDYFFIMRGYMETADSFITNVFGVGTMSELIAYVGSWVATEKNIPIYIKHVYRKILKGCKELQITQVVAHHRKLP